MGNKIVDGQTGTMERLLASMPFDPEAKKPSVFQLSAPLLDQGNDRFHMAHTDRMWLFITVFSPNDGENKLHAHTNEDHAFVVLDGVAKFSSPGEDSVTLQKYHGIMLPRGTFYTFKAMEDRPLVLLRIGCIVDEHASPFARILETGDSVLGNSTENNAITPVRRPGAFFPGDPGGSP